MDGYDRDLDGLARRLRMARASLGITQAEAASRAGVSQSALSLWERARRVPDALAVRRLAITYSVTTDWLLGM